MRAGPSPSLANAIASTTIYNIDFHQRHSHLHFTQYFEFLSMMVGMVLHDHLHAVKLFRKKNAGVVMGKG